jgi:hypothetical protein
VVPALIRHTSLSVILFGVQSSYNRLRALATCKYSRDTIPLVMDIFYNTPPGSGVLLGPPQPKPSDPDGTGRTSFPPTVLTWPSAGAACFLNMNMGLRPSLSSCLNSIKGRSFNPRQRSWSPCTIYRAYWRQSAVMLYFLSATGSTLWHGSSMDTRKDLKISTCGFVDGVEAGLEVGAFSVLEPPDNGGSRSSGFGVGCALFRSGRDESGAGVPRGSRLRSDTMVDSDVQVPDWGQLGVPS